jgi:UDP-glucuronate 4-epimerase
MALQKFTQAIIKGETIKIFNHGKHRRDFTYIDDIVEGIIRVLDRPAVSNAKWSGDKPDPSSSKAPWRLYNIGNNSPVDLMDYIKKLEKALNKEANKEFLPIQAGDVPDTWANIDDLVKEFEYKPMVEIDEGIKNFVNWFEDYYKL